MLPAANVLCGAKLRICRHLLQLLRRLACTCPYEVAGFLLGRVSGSTLEASVAVLGCNVSEDPERSFLVDGRTLYRVVLMSERGGLHVVAVFHTHPAGAPFLSGADLRGMEAWPTVWLVVGCGGVGAWAPCGPGVAWVELEPVLQGCELVESGCSPCPGRAIGNASSAPRSL